MYEIQITLTNGFKHKVVLDDYHEAVNYLEEEAHLKTGIICEIGDHGFKKLILTKRGKNERIKRSTKR